MAPKSPSFIKKDSGTVELARAYGLMNEAQELDEAGFQDEALEVYKDGVELCLRTKEETRDTATKEKLHKLAKMALERAEDIKGIGQPQKQQAVSKSDTQTKTSRPQASLGLVKPLGNLNINDGPSAAGAGGYTDEEKKVLAVTSNINGREYVPFMMADLKERFAFPVPWTDRHGKLDLSPKQKQRLRAWCRPDEFIAHPKMIEVVDCFSVKQTVVSDCSFVASIAIAAQYEKKFKKKLITSIIYPQVQY